MAEDVLITFMPNEVIELILENEELTIQDTVNFALSCKHLQRIVLGSNKLWRTKFFMRYFYVLFCAAACIILIAFDAT